MNSRFAFLSIEQAQLLDEISNRRSPSLLERIRNVKSVSRSDAEDIMSLVSDELTDNLDDHWEPTEHRRAVGAMLAKFNAARVNEWQ